MKLLIYNFLELVSPLLVVAALLVRFRLWQLVRHMQALFAYFLVSVILLGVATYLAMYNIPNMVWYNAHGFCSLLFLSLFFYSIVASKIYKLLVLAFCVFGLSTYVFLLLFWDDNTTFFSSGYAVSSLMIIIYCFLFLKEIFHSAGRWPGHANSSIWIVSGLLTYYLSVYIIHVTYKAFTQYFTSKEVVPSFDIGVLWGIHNVIYFLSCSFIAYMVLRYNKKVPIM